MSLYQIASSGGFTADDEMWFMSGAAAVGTFTPAVDLVLVLNSNGTLASSFTMTREQALAFMSSLTGTVSFGMSGSFVLALDSNALITSLQSLAIGTQPDLRTDGVVWVVNLDNKASSQYEQYGFNSFFERGGVFYGVAGNGIYKLEGNTDSGDQISALITTGRSTFNTNKEKSVKNVYLGLSSTNRMVLKVDVDGSAYYYTARSNDSNMNNQRVDIGKGLKGNYWQFTLLNSEGCDFELESIEFTPVILRRGI